jgi:hypothetical protein
MFLPEDRRLGERDWLIVTTYAGTDRSIYRDISLYPVPGPCKNIFNSFYFSADRPHILDIAHAEIHSFIAEECLTSKKFFVNGKFSYLMKHNITRIFPRAKTIWQNSYFNIRVTPKTLRDEKDIYKVSK